MTWASGCFRNFSRDGSSEKSLNKNNTVRLAFTCFEHVWRNCRKPPCNEGNQWWGIVEHLPVSHSFTIQGKVKLLTCMSLVLWQQLEGGCFGRAFLPSIMYILYIYIWFLYKPRFFCFPWICLSTPNGDCSLTSHQVFRSWWSWVPCRCFSTAMVMTNGRWSWRRRLRPNWLPLATTFWRFVALGCSIFSAGFFVKLKVDLIGFLRQGWV